MFCLFWRKNQLRVTRKVWTVKFALRCSSEKMFLKFVYCTSGLHYFVKTWHFILYIHIYCFTADGTVV
jgi:hypothetical protein